VYSINHKTGRLVDASLVSPLTLEELDTAVLALRAILMRMQGSAVLCMDLRRLLVLQQEAADRFLVMMRADSARVERTAYLLPEGNAVLSLQMDRILREAGGEARRAFSRPAGLRAWLAPILKEAEQKRLDEVLAPLPAIEPPRRALESVPDHGGGHERPRRQPGGRLR
jgi:hypothetical protein